MKKNSISETLRRNFEEFRKLNLTQKLFLAAPFLLGFSYWPQISFGRSGGVNQEISLALAFVVIFGAAGFFENFRAIWRIRKSPAIWLTGAWILWNFLSIFWSKNPLRTFFVSGVWGAIWFDFIVILAFSKEKSAAKLFSKFRQMVIFSGIFFSILAIFQVIYGAFTDWGLCRGCLAQGFGFVRSSVFFIEPQFFGNFLIAPILLLWSDFLRKGISKVQISGLILMLAAEWLTLSRGAIFAVVFAMVLMIFFANFKGFRRSRVEFLSKKNLKTHVRNSSFLALILALGFGSGLILHGAMTALNPRVADGFYDSVSKSVNQMTLGKINLPKISKPSPRQNVEKPVEKTVDNSVENRQNKSENRAIFDGYVEKSTSERTKLSDSATQTWLLNPKSLIFGVGSGAAGRAIFETGATVSEYEIIQNEFLSVALENGIFGLIIWLAIVFGFVKRTRFEKSYWAILAAFLFQWMFFSGLPNALHIYLILAAIFAFSNFEKIEKVSKI